MEISNGFAPFVPPQSVPLNNKFLEIGRTGKNDWWRYALGILIVMVVGYVIIGQLPITILFFYAIAKGYVNMYDPDLESKILNPAVMHVDANVLLIFEFFIFIGAMFALWVVIKFLHKKQFLSIITSSPKIRWKRFAVSAITWMILCFIGLFVALKLYPEDFTFVFRLKPFLFTLLIGLLFLPIQTFWEEFFFRGYIFQSIGLKTKTPVLPIMITAFIFAGVHMLNPEVKAYGVVAMFPAYLLPGIFLALMAALDEGLESAMGMHFANNLFGTFAVTSSSSAIQGNTIWIQKDIYPGSDNLVLFISFFILMAVLSRTNKWNFSKLYR